MSADVAKKGGGGRRGAARHGNRRRDSPGPLKSETAQSSCPRPSPPPAPSPRPPLLASSPPRPRPLRPVRRPQELACSLSLSLSLLLLAALKNPSPPSPPRARCGAAVGQCGTPLRKHPVAPTLSLLLCFSSTFKGAIGLNPAPRGGGRGGSLVAGKCKKRARVPPRPPCGEGGPGGGERGSRVFLGRE